MTVRRDPLALATVSSPVQPRSSANARPTRASGPAPALRGADHLFRSHTPLALAAEPALVAISADQQRAFGVELAAPTRRGRHPDPSLSGPGRGAESPIASRFHAPGGRDRGAAGGRRRARRARPGAGTPAQPGAGGHAEQLSGGGHTPRAGRESARPRPQAAQRGRHRRTSAAGEPGQSAGTGDHGRPAPPTAATVWFLGGSTSMR